jgi:NADH-quinone oxidoreductase subunit A
MYNATSPHLEPFVAILIFAAGGLGFVLISLLVSKIIRPRRPNPEKNSSYESGEAAIGQSWPQLNPRFYVLALIFLLFEVEIIVVFLWAPVFTDEAMMANTQGLWGWFSLVEIFVFVVILAIGLAYAWVNGHLDWLKSMPQKSTFKSTVPREFYDAVNERYAKHGPTDGK